MDIAGVAMSTLAMGALAASRCSRQNPPGPATPRLCSCFTGLGRTVPSGSGDDPSFNGEERRQVEIRVLLAF